MNIPSVGTTDHDMAAADILRQICEGMELDGLPMPDEMFKWWEEDNRVIVLDS